MIYRKVTMALYLRQARLSQNMTQTQLGKKIAVTGKSISALELGLRRGRVTTWDRLEEALGIPAKRLRTVIKETS
jgi:transcriptional regulator with XRE-family HTH domain